jgi:hypothetical protein
MWEFVPGGDDFRLASCLAEILAEEVLEQTQPDLIDILKHEAEVVIDSNKPVGLHWTKNHLTVVLHNDDYESVLYVLAQVRLRHCFYHYSNKGSDFMEKEIQVFVETFKKIIKNSFYNRKNIKGKMLISQHDAMSI